MNTETSAANTEATDTSATSTSQEKPVKTYTQEEFDNHMAGLKASLSKKLLKPYEELGDIEELRQLKQAAQQQAQEQQLKRGEFDKIIQELAQKKDAEIQRRDAIIQEYRVDVPLLNAAAQFRSVNPEQVKALLKSNVRLNADGDVEVVDTTGQVRYSDSGTPMQVQDLVREFLDSNPHFVQPTPSTTNSKSSMANNGQGKIDLSKLDMKNAEHRKLYAEFRASKKN